MRLKCLCLLFFLSRSIAASVWQPLAPGLDYQDFTSSAFTSWFHIHVFRINLQYYKFKLLMASDLNTHLASAEEFRAGSDAILAVNGGFFDNAYRPLGLRAQNGHIEIPLKPISWWGVFYIRNQKAYIRPPKNFRMQNNIEMAVQSGPRLLVRGKIPSLKPGRARRTALGIGRDGSVYIVVTGNAAITTTELAEFMMAAPLDCTDALNLDGGSSSQLHALLDDFQLNVRGYTGVSDALVLKAR